VTTVLTTTQRTRALLLLIVSILFYKAVEVFASRAAFLLAGSAWFDVVYESLRLVLLLAGFSLLVRLQLQPVERISPLGWARTGETRLQIGMGTAVGWGIAVAVVSAIVLAGGLQIFFDFSAASWGAFFLALLMTGLGAAVRQTVFAGFPFQKLTDAVGPWLATIATACFVGFTQTQDLQAGRIAIVTVILLQVLFCIAALRTGSLWLGWALDVTVRLSLGAVFGLPVAGSGKYTSVILSNSRAPDWLSGGAYGPAGSLLAPLAVLVGIYVVVRVTRVDVIANIRPGGIALDLQPQHAPSFPAADPVPVKPAGGSLVQIVPVSAPPAGSGQDPGDTSSS